MSGDKIPKALRLFVETARELRSAADEADIAFMRHLESGDASGIWKGVYESFVECLKRNNICEPARYGKWKEAQSIIGTSDIGRIGSVDGVIAAARVEDDGKRRSVITKFVEFRKQNGAPIGQQSAATVLLREGVRPTAPRIQTPQALTEEGLRQEVLQLKQENQKLRRENAEQLAELTKLRAAMPIGRTSRRSTAKAAQEARA